MLSVDRDATRKTLEVSGYPRNDEGRRKLPGERDHAGHGTGSEKARGTKDAMD